MPNTSATGGYLDPATNPLDDDALVDFLQAVVAAISGLPGALVRPRFQEEPPNLPKRGTTWAGVGLGDQESDIMGHVEHDPTIGTDGGDVLRTHETLQILCSFYGPQARARAHQLADGLKVAQNREVLTLAGMGLQSVGRMIQTSELIKERWLARTDVTVTIRREIRREYPVLSLLSASGTITPDPGSESAFNVNA